VYIRWFLYVGLALVTSLVLFVSIPIANYYRLKAQGLLGPKEVAIQVQQQVKIPPKKKPPQKPKPKPKKVSRKSKPTSKKLARSRVAMDLGSGDGAGPGIGVGDGDVITYREGEVDQEASPILPLKAPSYPAAAQEAGISGTVLCELTIDESGRVVNVEFIQVPGPYGFEGEILKAVQKWKFKPAMAGGVPVRFRLRQPFEF
jgi:TonB family protein